MPEALGTGIVAVICFTALGMLLFTFRTYREGSYRRGQGWYLDARQPTEGPLPAYRREPRSLFVPPRLVWSWGSIGAALLVAGIVSWTVLHIPGLALLVGVFGVVFVGGAVGGWRQDRYLQAKATSPLVDVVDRGLLRFSPRTDALIREICALGGRERLEREFGCRDGPGEDIPLEDLHARLDEIRNEMTGGQL